MVGVQGAVTCFSILNGIYCPAPPAVYNGELCLVCIWMKLLQLPHLATEIKDPISMTTSLQAILARTPFIHVFLKELQRKGLLCWWLEDYT